MMAAPMICALCSESTPNDGRFIKCVDITKAYHLERSALVLFESTFDCMTA